jgi:RNA polymerase sigma-70 factor, ECF subfamily
MHKKWQQFETYYVQYIGPVYRYIALRVQNSAEAEDLVSDIFMKALEHFDEFDESRPFSNWIFTIAHNHLITHLQRRKSTVHLDDIAELQNPYNLEKEFIDHQAFEQIKQTMQKLDPEKQQMIEWKYLLGYSYQEIGTILGKSENSVKVATFRAMEELKKNLPLSS